jgi:hypothetical protein
MGQNLCVIRVLDQLVANQRLQVRVCRVIRNEGHHFIVEYAISAMLEGLRPNAASRVAPVPSEFFGLLCVLGLIRYR